MPDDGEESSLPPFSQLINKNNDDAQTPTAGTSIVSQSQQPFGMNKQGDNKDIEGMISPTSAAATANKEAAFDG